MSKSNYKNKDGNEIEFSSPEMNSYESQSSSDSSDSSESGPTLTLKQIKEKHDRKK